MICNAFISYATKDLGEARRVLDHLETAGLACFLADRHIRAGAPFSDVLVRKLNEALGLVVVFSPHCNRSRYVEDEVRLAYEQAKPIVTFRLADATPEGALQLYLGGRNWINAFPTVTRLHLDALAEAVREWVPPAFERLLEAPSIRDALAAAEELRLQPTDELCARLRQALSAEADPARAIAMGWLSAAWFRDEAQHLIRAAIKEHHRHTNALQSLLTILLSLAGPECAHDIAQALREGDPIQQHRIMQAVSEHPSVLTADTTIADALREVEHSTLDETVGEMARRLLEMSRVARTRRCRAGPGHPRRPTSPQALRKSPGSARRATRARR